MRILYHHRTLADGAEGIHIAEMVNAFRTLGHEVLVIGLAANDAAPARRGWIAHLRDLLPAGLFEAASVATNALEYVQMQRAIATFTPDLVYKRHARNDVGALNAARRAKVPVGLEVNCLFTGPGYQQFEPIALERVASRLEKHALQSATVCLAVSSPLARQILETAGANAIVVPNGADPQRFDPLRVAPLAVRERYALGGSFVVGWTGVIREWHGLDRLLYALVHLQNARLLIVGDGPGRAAVHALAISLGLRERVTITGRVPHAEVPDHIAAMDVAVIANDRTGVASPMKLLEYMAMARAVAAPALPNIEDVITHGANGWLFRPDDVPDLVRGLRTLSQDTTLRQRLGDAARRAVVETRNWQHIAAYVLSILPNSLAKSAGHGASNVATEGGTLLRSSPSDEKYPLGPCVIGSDDDVV